ncbi:sigma-70 region 2 [Peptoniphilus sp. oral taxon 375 str. F0436]|nr:sigma-70 region 2 [Peptoniphilus sp. oral taxon 375 str. F0436]
MKVILDPRGYSMEEVYEAYEGLCRKTVRAYGWEGVSKEDLFQECVLELCRCVRDFDPDRGVAFPAYVQRALKYRVYGAQRKWLKGQVDSLDAGEDFQEALLDPFDLEEAVCREEEKDGWIFIWGFYLPGRRRFYVSIIMKICLCRKLQVFWAWPIRRWRTLRRLG